MWIFSRILILTGLLLSIGSVYAVEQPGPSAALLANPIYSGGIGLLYTCPTNYYVNANTGNDSNNGLTAGAAFATIQHADTIGGPGICVNVAPGTYTWTTTYIPTKGGNQASPTGYMVYRCQVLDQCLVVYAGNIGARERFWEVPIPYIIIDGFDLDGGEAATFGGIANTCISSDMFDDPQPSHHLWLLNSRFHGCTESCIQFGDSEFFFVLHSEVFNCSWTDIFQGSGISLVGPKALGAPLNPYPPYTPTVYDQTFAPFHNIFSWNKVYHNGCVYCTGLIQSYSTTANTNGTTTLSNIGSVGTSASFTGTITTYAPNAAVSMIDVSSIMGTISVGDQVSFTTNGGPACCFQSFIGTSIFAQSGANCPTCTGTGGNGTYLLNFPWGGFLTSGAVTSATLGPAVYVTGPGILPFTYTATTVSGGSLTLTRPAQTTQTGGTFTFYTPAFQNHTDGNGIIMDTFCGAECGGNGIDYNYQDKQTLVSFNDVQFNGGRGTNLFAAFNVTVANNSMYHNGMDLYGNGFWADINITGSVNSNVYNNIAYSIESINTECAFEPIMITCNYPLLAGDGRGQTSTNNAYQHNDLFGGGGVITFNNDTAYYAAGVNITRDPLFTGEPSTVAIPLTLQAGSPAIEFALPRAFPYLPKGTTDSGAYQTGGLRSAYIVSSVPEFTGYISLFSLPIITKPLTCSQATAWLARISGYDRIHHDAYSNLICGLVNAGLWCDTTMDILYIWATYSPEAAGLNLCSSNYVPVFHGPPAFTNDRGYLGIDGSTTVYADTQFNPSTAVSPFYTLNDAHLSVYINNNTRSVLPFSGYALGACCGSFQGSAYINPRLLAVGPLSAFEVDVNNVMLDSTHAIDQPTSLGHFLATRADNITVSAYFDSVLQFTQSQASSAVNANFYALALNLVGTGPDLGGPFQVGAVTVGKHLSSTGQQTLCHLLRAYMLAVGNVGGTC